MNTRFRLLFYVMTSGALIPGVLRAEEVLENSAACSFAGRQKLYLPLKTADIVATYTDPALKLAGYKTEAAVDQYLECWKEAGPNFTIYKTKYKKMIQAAASATRIPFSILACLYFYESKFDKDAGQKVDPEKGAKGLAQIMPETWKVMVANLDTSKAALTNPWVVSTLEQALKKTPLSSKDRNSIRPLIAKVKKLYAEKFVNGQLSGKSSLESLRAALDALEKYPTFAEAGSVDQYRSNVEVALDKHEMREMFDRYKKSLGKTKLEMDVFSPEAAIIMGALTLKVNVFQGIFGQEYREGTHDRWVIAAGGYNIGPARIKCTANMTAQECITLTRNTETSDHMRGIKNCSEHGNFKDKKDKASAKGCKG